MNLPSADAERRRICRYEPAPCPSSFPAELVPHWHFLQFSYTPIQAGFAFLDQQKKRACAKKRGIRVSTCLTLSRVHRQW
jgi:hypothetical protein